MNNAGAETADIETPIPLATLHRFSDSAIDPGYGHQRARGCVLCALRQAVAER